MDIRSEAEASLNHKIHTQAVMLKQHGDEVKIPMPVRLQTFGRIRRNYTFNTRKSTYLKINGCEVITSF